jgi:hypothetical protein
MIYGLFAILAEKYPPFLVKMLEFASSCGRDNREKQQKMGGGAVKKSR